MNTKLNHQLLILFIGLLITACNGGAKEEKNNKKPGKEHTDQGHQGADESMRMVHLSDFKFNSLGVKVDTIPMRSLKGIVKANGQLEVPPQHEATVTPTIGGNISSIKVIEGDRVYKGQILAYVSHPDLIQLQKNYMMAVNSLEYIQQEMDRQKRLNEAGIGAGKDLQRIQSKYKITRGEISGFEAQLQQLHLSVTKIKNGTIYQNVPIVSPITGYIEKVLVQIGQYADERTNLFMIVNTEHIHADLMVFEKDVHKLKNGQTVRFKFESDPQREMEATIYSIGKQFEQNPKAVHVHAEIQNKSDNLIPGMYINGSIITDNEKVKALPEEAIIEDGGKPYIFTATRIEENNEMKWEFEAREIRTGTVNNGWVEVKLLEPIVDSTIVAWNNGYYLISEMKKSQVSHSH